MKEPPDEMMKLLKQIVEAYAALQESNGASQFMDVSQTFTVGQWLAGRMLKTHEEAKALLERVEESHMGCPTCGNRFYSYKEDYPQNVKVKS